MQPSHAERLAHGLLAGTGDRWRHTRGVARRAAELAGPLGLDPDLLVSAAWLHDIGYAVPATGFHPLDGADHLIACGGPPRIAGLVAHHSGARFAAAALGLSDALARYPDEGGPVADALSYADQTVGPRGDRTTPDERYAEMLRRQGPDSANARAHPGRSAYLRAVVHRVESRLRSRVLLAG